MSFGWSPSDILSLAKLCYDIYSFCQSAPIELQGIFSKVDKIGQKLERLSYILEKSGLGTWRQTPDVHQHLHDARSFLDTLRPATDKASNGPSKAKGLVRLAFNREKLRRLEKDLDDDEKEINEMKMDMILICSLRQLELQSHVPFSTTSVNLRPSRMHETGQSSNRYYLPNPARTEIAPRSDDASSSATASTTTSDASQALAMALRLRNRLDQEAGSIFVSEDALDPNLRNGQTADEFVTNVISLAEAAELYSKESDLAQGSKPLARMVETMTRSSLESDSWRKNSRASKELHRLSVAGELGSGSLESDFLHYLSSTSDSASTRLWALNQSLARRSTSSTTSAMTLSLMLTKSSGETPSEQPSFPSYSSARHTAEDVDDMFTMDFDALTNITTKSSIKSIDYETIVLEGRSRVGLGTKPQTLMDCYFDMKSSEGSLTLRAIPIESLRSVKDATTGSDRPHSTPSPSLRESVLRDEARHTLPLRTLQHCFQTHTRPIPHLLHPQIEGSTENPDAPYAITFSRRQFVSVEGAAGGPRWTKSLAYVFYEKSDRVSLCERIFGKRLIMISGTNRISQDGRELSHMSAIVLWLDLSSGVKSITFSPNLASKGGHRDIELQVHGLWDKDKATKDANVVTIAAEPIDKNKQSTDAPVRVDQVSSVKPSGRFFSRSSTNTSQTADGRTNKLKCVIEFTHSNDKASFVNYLR